MWSYMICQLAPALQGVLRWFRCADIGAANKCKDEFCFILGVIPGPSAPKSMDAYLDHFLQPFLRFGPGSEFPPFAFIAVILTLPIIVVFWGGFGGRTSFSVQLVALLSHKIVLGDGGFLTFLTLVLHTCASSNMSDFVEPGGSQARACLCATHPRMRMAP